MSGINWMQIHNDWHCHLSKSIKTWRIFKVKTNACDRPLYKLGQLINKYCRTHKSLWVRTSPPNEMSLYSITVSRGDNSHLCNLPCLRAHIAYTNQSPLQTPWGSRLYSMNISNLLFLRDYTGASLVIHTVLEKTSSCLQPSKHTFDNYYMCNCENFMWIGAVKMYLH